MAAAVSERSKHKARSRSRPRRPLAHPGAAAPAPPPTTLYWRDHGTVKGERQAHRSVDGMKRLASRSTWWHTLPHKSTHAVNAAGGEASHGPYWDLSFVGGGSGKNPAGDTKSPGDLRRQGFGPSVGGVLQLVKL